MAQEKDLPLKVRLKKFIDQYTDSGANAANLFMYGILFLFVLILIVVLLFSAKLQDGIKQIELVPTTSEQVETTK